MVALSAAATPFSNLAGDGRTLTERVGDVARNAVGRLDRPLSVDELATWGAAIGPLLRAQQRTCCRRRPERPAVPRPSGGRSLASVAEQRHAFRSAPHIEIGARDTSPFQWTRIDSIASRINCTASTRHKRTCQGSYGMVLAPGHTTRTGTNRAPHTEAQRNGRRRAPSPRSHMPRRLRCNSLYGPLMP